MEHLNRVIDFFEYSNPVLYDRYQKRILHRWGRQLDGEEITYFFVKIRSQKKRDEICKYFNEVRIQQRVYKNWLIRKKKNKAEKAFELIYSNRKTAFNLLRQHYDYSFNPKGIIMY